MWTKKCNTVDVFFLAVSPSLTLSRWQCITLLNYTEMKSILCIFHIRLLCNHINSFVVSIASRFMCDNWYCFAFISCTHRNVYAKSSIKMEYFYVNFYCSALNLISLRNRVIWQLDLHAVLSVCLFHNVDPVSYLSQRKSEMLVNRLEKKQLLVIAECESKSKIFCEKKILLGIRKSVAIWKKITCERLLWKFSKNSKAN